MYYEKYNQYGYAIGELGVIVSHKSNPTEFQDNFYFYRFFVELDNEQHYEAALWCEENCQDKWLVGIEESDFVNEEDAMAFKLRWI